MTAAFPIDSSVLTINFGDCFYDVSNHEFVYQLPQPQHLDVNHGYELRVDNFTFAGDYSNLGKCYISIKHRESENVHYFHIRNNCMTYNSGLTDQCNVIARSDDFKQFILAHLPDGMQIGQVLTFTIGSTTHPSLVKVKSNLTDQIRPLFDIQMSPRLATKLGFMETALNDATSEARMPVNLAYGCEHVFLHCNVVQPTIYNQTPLPLLMNFAVERDTRMSGVSEYNYPISVRKHNYRSLQWHPLRESVLSQLRFKLTHEDGAPVDICTCTRINCILTLVVRRRLLCIG
jgi:hypothetical protein